MSSEDTHTPSLPIPEKQVELLFGDMREVRLAPVSAHLNSVGATMVELGGPEAVLELIAVGRLPSEIAATYNIPQMGFRRWVDQHINPVDLAGAFQVGAETLVYKATALLGLGSTSKSEADQARALAVQFMKIAERIDPGRWAPRKDIGASGGMAVSINMDFGNGQKAAIGAGARDVTPETRAASVPRVTMVEEPDMTDLLTGDTAALPFEQAIAYPEGPAEPVGLPPVPTPPSFPPAPNAESGPVWRALENALTNPRGWSR